MDETKINTMNANPSRKIKKKKRKMKKTAAIAKFTKIFDHENETSELINHKKKNSKRKFKTKKKQKKTVCTPKYNNPHHLNNKYIQYAQQFNTKPTISQFCNFADVTYVESKNIITRKQNIAINAIKNSQIIHRHFSQIEPISYTTNPKAKPKSLFSHPYAFVNIKTKLKFAFEGMEQIKRERRRIRRGKVAQNEIVLALINGYCRIHFNNNHIQMPLDVIDILYLVFFDAWWSIMCDAMIQGFAKATIICRSSYATLACSSHDHIATAWYEADGGKLINENQELLDDWNVKSSFCFYGKRYQIYKFDSMNNEICCFTTGQYDNECSYLDICVVKQTKYVWCVLTKEMKVKGKGVQNMAKIAKTFVHAGKFWSQFTWS